MWFGTAGRGHTRVVRFLQRICPPARDAGAGCHRRPSPGAAESGGITLANSVRHSSRDRPLALTRGVLSLLDATYGTPTVREGIAPEPAAACKFSVTGH